MRGLLATRLLGGAILAVLAGAAAWAIELDVTGIQSAFRMAKVQAKPRPNTHEKYHIGFTPLQ